LFEHLDEAEKEALLAVPHDRDGVTSFTKFVWLWNFLEGRDTPALHDQMAGWLNDRRSAGDRRILMLVFRDSGKSTLVGLFSAWLLARNPELRILVLSSEHALATKMTRTVRRIIERHPQTRHLLPKKAELWAADQLTVQRSTTLRDPSLLARGISANITGTRADIVICDDVEVPNTCDSAGKRAELRERLAEVSFVLVPDGLQLYVGTPHSYHSIYADTPRPETGEERCFLEGFERLVLPVFDEQGESRWPERFTKERLAEMERQAGPLKFRSQMLLIPTHTQEVRLDPDKLLSYRGDISVTYANGRPVLQIGGRRMVAASCWWDPSYGRPESGDASAIAVVFVDDDNHYWLHGLSYLTFDHRLLPESDEAIQLCRQAIEFAVAHEQPSLTVEANGLGRFLPGLLRREIRARRAGLSVIEHVSSGSKDRRILKAFDPILAAGHLHVHENVLHSGFVEEMREWLPGGRGRDDALDAVSGCLLNQPVRLGHGGPLARRPHWHGSGGQWMAKTDFVI